MTQDNFMYEWRKAKEHYDALEDGTIIIHEDAPGYVKESYQEYARIMKKVKEFPDRKRSSHSLFSHWKMQKKDKSEERSNTEATRASLPTQFHHVKAIFDNEERKQIAERILQSLMPEQEGECSNISETSAALPFWACYQDDEAIGFLALRKHTPKGAEIYAIAVKKEYQGKRIAHALMKECEAWCRSDGISYLQIKVPSTEDMSLSSLQGFAQSCHFCELERISLTDREHRSCMVMVKKI